MLKTTSYKMSRIINLRKWRATINLRKKGEMFFGQLPMLEYIHLNPGCNQNDIASVMSFSRAAISKGIGKLTAKELVVREISLNDSREYCLHLTEKGESAYQMFRNCCDEVEALTYKGISESDIKTFESTLDRMLANLEEENYSRRNLEMLIKKHKKD